MLTKICQNILEFCPYRCITREMNENVHCANTLALTFVIN